MVLTQLRNAGLYPAVDAPSFNQHGGQMRAGFDLRMNATSGTVYYTLDGTDPRLPDGTLSPAAIAYPAVNTTNTLIAKNSTWKYLDNGSDQGTAWRIPFPIPILGKADRVSSDMAKRDEATTDRPRPAAGRRGFHHHVFPPHVFGHQSRRRSAR